MKILVINGPNINMLGIREPGIYGKNTFADLLALLDETARAESLEIEQYQSNHEGCLVDKIQEAFGKVDGIVINPAAYTHTSVAILDALKSVSIPAVEVTSPMWMPGNPSGRFPMQALPAKRPSKDMVWQAIRKPSSI